jgi:hypothetical protein
VRNVSELLLTEVAAVAFYFIALLIHAMFARQNVSENEWIKNTKYLSYIYLWMCVATMVSVLFCWMMLQLISVNS